MKKTVARKRYEVRGMMEWHPEFRAGRTRLQVAFTGGHLCGGACTAASYETSDPVVQKVIEGSEPFRSGRIRLSREWRNRDDGRKDPLPAGSGGPARFEYGDEEDIYEFLHNEKGVPLEQLTDRGSCFSVAERLGVTLVRKSVSER